MARALTRSITPFLAAVFLTIPASASSAPSISSQVSNIVRHSPVGAATSVIVFDASSGSQLASIKADRSVTPASNEKLYTAFAALRVMGPEGRLHTLLRSSATQVGARLGGDLYLVGGGDPTLSTRAFARRNYPGYASTIDDLAEAVASRGIRRITGNIIVDDSWLDRSRWLGAWPARFRFDEINPVGALTVNHGCTGRSLSSAAGSAPDVNAGGVLLGLLHARGIAVDGAVVRGTAPTDATTLADLPSPPVRTIVRFMGRFSDNFTAEVIERDVGRVGGGLGTTARGAAVVRMQLIDAGLDAARLTVIDGSGLSVANHTTAFQLAQLIRIADTGEPLQSLAFLDALAVNGYAGTLEDRLRTRRYRGRLHAKTGTLRSVSALTGFADGASGRRYGFSIVVHRPGGQVPYGAAHVLQDRIAAALLAA